MQRAWLQRGPLAWLLLGPSWLYRALVALRRGLYSRGLLGSYRAGVPVIVVGNVIAGGAGKTPVVIELVRQLRSQGWQPGVVSRGYGRAVADGADECIEVTAQTPAHLAGDEPALIQHATGVPVWVSKQRARAVQRMLAAYPQTNVIVSDDGLQHLALQRDIEVCVFDQRGVGNGWLLPAGPLREPWPRKVDAVLRSTSTGSPGAQAWPAHGAPEHPVQRRLADHALRADGSQLPLASLQGRRLTALAGIAQPDAFFTMLRAQGITLAETISLADHYNFDSWSRDDLLGQTLICTQKDAVKLWRHRPDALAVPLVVDIAPEFFTAVVEKLSSCTLKATG